MAGMVQDEGSSSVTSSPLQCFSQMSLSPAALGSPYAPWLRELKSDERGLYLIHLLLNCANHVAAGGLEHANAFLEHISLLASPDGDTMQRIAAHFTEALARRALRSSWPGLYRALDTTTARAIAAASLAAEAAAAARRHFLDLCPFLRLAFLVSNQAILEAMDGERMVHIIDLNAADPTQWLSLLQALSLRPEGPPHLRITGVHEQKELLTHTAMCLTKEAERLDIPFQFNAVVRGPDGLDVASLRVKTGEALAISSALHLHSLLASDQKAAAAAPTPPAKNSGRLHRIAQMGHGGAQGDWLEKEAANGCSPSPESALSSSPPFASPAPAPAPAPAARAAEAFLASLWALSPKVMVVTEQEANHNGSSLNERFTEALNFYAALFDCLESTMPRQSVERMRVEKMLFGEEIKSIITCEGPERKERHEKLERWAQRLDAAGFGRLPLSYYALLQARRFLQSFGCEGYKLKEDNGCLFICWQDRPLFSVSAWRCRRFD